MRSSATEMRLITAAVIVSALGTWSYNVAIAVYAYEQTGSTAWVAAATVGRYIPALLIASVGARLTSRFPRRTVAVVCDVLCAIAMAALTAGAAGGGSLVLAIALAGLSSGAARIQSAAALALAADVVVETELVRRMSFLSTAESVATAVGPALASLVLLVASPAWLFLLNAVSFLVSAVLLLGVRPRRRLAASRTSVDVTSNRRTVRRTVWPLMAVRTVGAFVYGADVVVLAVVATEDLRSATTGYGWLLTAAGVGGLICASALRSASGEGGVVRRTLVGAVLYTVPLLVLAYAAGIFPALGAQLVRGAGFVLVVTVVVTALQRSVTSDLSQDGFGQLHSLVLVGTVAGSLAAPLLLGWLGLDLALVVLAVVPLLAVVALLGPLRRYESLAEFSAAALDPVVATLRQLSLFRDASRWTLIEIADRLRASAVPAGTVVVAQGDEADSLYVLVEGTVEVTAESTSGTVEHLRTMHGPAYFGEIGIVHRMPRTATVTASQPSTLWRIPADAFLDAVAQAGISGGLDDTVRVRMGNTPGRPQPIDA